MHAVGYGSARQARRDRRVAQERRHRRVHLRESPEVRRPRVWTRSPAAPGSAERAEGRGPIRTRDLGRGDGDHRRAHAGREGGARRRVDPAVFVRRVERSPDAGQFRRAAVAAVRHIASGANAVRGADRRRQHGALRQDAVGHLPGLSRGRADHPVGRQPVVIGHPSHPVRSRGTAARREARRRRSPIDSDVAGG